MFLPYTILLQKFVSSGASFLYTYSSIERHIEKQSTYYTLEIDKTVLTYLEEEICIR